MFVKTDVASYWQLGERKIYLTISGALINKLNIRELRQTEFKSLLKLKDNYDGDRDSYNDVIIAAANDDLEYLEEYMERRGDAYYRIIPFTSEETMIRLLSSDVDLINGLSYDTKVVVEKAAKYKKYKIMKYIIPFIETRTETEARILAEVAVKDERYEIAQAVLDMQTDEETRWSIAEIFVLYALLYNKPIFLQMFTKLSTDIVAQVINNNILDFSNSDDDIITQTQERDKGILANNYEVLEYISKLPQPEELEFQDALKWAQQLFTLKDWGYYCLARSMDI